jgi:GT2 family glycosyltransferase
MFSVDVVIPVLNEVAHTESLLSDICENSICPQQIIIIDNGSTDATPDVVQSFTDKLPIVYLQNETNLGVNASWNLGTKLATADLVSVLNNDLILNKYFFEGVIKTFKLNPNCGMACPRTTQGSCDGQKNLARNSKLREENCVSHVPWRWGWAFTMKRDLALQVLIPKTLFNYCGDDYHYHFLKLFGYEILCMDDNFVYHYGGITGKNSGLDSKMHADTHQWNLIKGRIDKGEDWKSVLEEQVKLASFGENGNGAGK